jgi:hypothetical protein
LNQTNIVTRRENKRTHQNGKLNNVALRQRNHDKTGKKFNQCINHLFKLKGQRKYAQMLFRIKKRSKIAHFNLNKMKNLERRRSYISKQKLGLALYILKILLVVLIFA